MKFKEIAALGEKELNDKLNEANFELLKVSGQAAQGSGIKNTSQKKQLRKTIARIKTIMNKKK